MKKIISSMILFLCLSSYCWAIPSMEFTQYANFKKLCLWIKRAQEQIHQLTNVVSNQIMMIEDMKRQALTIPDVVYSNTARTIMDIAGVIKQGQMIVTDLSNFDEQFKQKVKRYKIDFKRDLKYTKKQLLFSKHYKELSKDNLKSIKGVLKLVGLQSEDFKTRNKLKDKIANMCESATGRNQLLQANSMLKDQQVDILEKMNSTITAQANMEATLNFTTRQLEEQSQDAIREFYKSRSSELVRGNGVPFP